MVNTGIKVDTGVDEVVVDRLGAGDEDVIDKIGAWQLSPYW